MSGYRVATCSKRIANVAGRFGIYEGRLPLCLVMTPDPDLATLIRTAQAEARAEATRPDGSVDSVAEALAFRRLVTEAAARQE